LVKDGVDILHTIGGDDTIPQQRILLAFLANNNYGPPPLSVCPKRLIMMFFPIKQSLGAWTAGRAGCTLLLNVVAENNANPRMLIVHEVMGRSCGWLTAATAQEYRKLLDRAEWLPELGLDRNAF